MRSFGQERFYERVRSIRLGRWTNDMRLLLIALLFVVAPSADAKEDVEAEIHTHISASAEAGAKIYLAWSLTDKKSGRPFSACAVFVRLISPTDESTAGFAGCGPLSSEGRYAAHVTVPEHGISRVEIGIAGTMTDRAGNSRRSDWLIPLSNDPIRE